MGSALEATTTTAPPAIAELETGDLERRGTFGHFERLVYMAQDIATGRDPVTDRNDLYATVFHTQFRRLMQLAVLLGADDPEDTVQEAFVRLHGRRDVLRDPNAVEAYIRRTVVNLSHSRLRSLRLARRHTVPETPCESAEQTALARAASSDLLRALAELPARQRDVVVLRYWLDLPIAEIANDLDMAVGTVKSTLHRAQAALAATMEGRR